MLKKSDILVVIAHPDDEIFASGTLCLLADKGFQIALVCVTDGENGSRQLFHRVRSDLPLGAVRRIELNLSAWVLGVRQVGFLGQIDIRPDEWGGGNGWNRPALVTSLAEILVESNPNLILTHGPLGGYGHPAHCEVNQCVMAAVQKTAYSGSVFSFAGQVKGAFFSWHFDQPSDVLIDSREFLRRRVASLSYHQTQSGFFLPPDFPRTIRGVLSALFGVAFAFTIVGRKRVPIVTTRRFCKKFPIEGLVLQKKPENGQCHFFARHFRNDRRVRIFA